MANIQCANIRKSYGGHTVIENLNLDIADHEFVVFLGPSGCGKSTMLRMIAGLEEITGGTVSIGDRDVTHLHPGERGVAMVFQSYALYPHMTVEENIAFGLRRQKVPQDEISRPREACRGASGAGELSRNASREPFGRAAAACCHGARHDQDTEALPLRRASVQS